MNGEIIIFIEMCLGCVVGERGAKWRYFYSFLSMGEEEVSESVFVCGGCVFEQSLQQRRKGEG